MPKSTKSGEAGRTVKARTNPNTVPFKALALPAVAAAARRKPQDRERRAVPLFDPTPCTD